jgi:hypothetical protein
LTREKAKWMEMRRKYEKAKDRMRAELKTHETTIA